MPRSSVCFSCLRALRQQARAEPFHTPRAYISRQPCQPRLLTSSTRSLAEDSRAKQPPPPPRATSPPSSPALPPDAFAQLARTARRTSSLRGTTEPYVAYGGTEQLFLECSKQCSYTIPQIQQKPPVPPPRNAEEADVGVGTGWWVEPKHSGGLGLEVTFNTWAQVMFLYVYCLTVRLRCFPREHARIWHQNLLDHFFYAAEDRMALWHGMVAKSVRNKYLKDLSMQWRGILLSYDEGLIKGDAVLATAVWRNVFRADEGVDIGDVAAVTAYLRSQLNLLDKLSDEEVASGDVRFEDPKGVWALMEGRESEWMQKSFKSEDLKEVEERKGGLA